MVRTPEYWKQKEYQPLVNCRTLFGNPVRMPQRYKESWEFQVELFNKIVAESGFQEGLHYMEHALEIVEESRGQNCIDLFLVMLERYL